ncbi:MAG: TonB-dependent receptor [Sphingomonas sp.]|nr:TonB-dependent receptor [Sphingomonas sp.]
MRRTALLLTTALLSTIAAPALAQTSGLEDQNDIIVTAQKVEQRALDVPITISAVTAKQMDTLGVSDLDEISNYVPGLNIQEQSANNPGIVIRGVTSDSGSAQQAARVTLYYNGVDISRSRGAYQGVYDMDRIEVIKGPQATLFGTASTIGAISLISARPKPGFSGNLTGGYGNYDQKLLSGYLNGGNDKVAGRVAFQWKKRDGYVHNLSDRQGDLYAQDQLGVRGSLRFTPTDDLTIDLVGTYDRQRNSGTPFISSIYPTANGPADPFGDANLSGAPAGISKSVLGSDDLGLTRDVYDANLTVSYDFADGWNFTTVNGYRDFDSREVFDADGSAAWYLEFAENAKGWQASHEGRFTYNDDHVRASFGWNFFHEDSRQVVPFSTEEGTYLQCSLLATGGSVPNPLNPGTNILPIAGLPCIAPDGTVTASQVTPALTNAFLGAPIAALPYSGAYANYGVNDSYSVFGDVAWNITQRLQFTVGTRVLIEQRKSEYTADMPNSQIFAAAGVLRPLLPVVDTAGQTYSATKSFSGVLPRFNLLYKINDGLNLYGTISKGRRSPTVNVVSAAGPRPDISVIPEETVWNYEGGVKYARGPLSASLGVYYDTYKGFQVSVRQGDGSFRTESAGDATNFGVEGEMSVRPVSWFNLFGNFAYTDAKIKDDARFQFAGDRFRLQPKWQAAGGFSIDAPIGNGMAVFATPSVTYRSKIYFELPNSEAASQDGVTLVNAKAGVRFGDGRFEIAGWVHNLTNEKYLLDAGNTGGSFGDITLIPAEPRFYGVQVSAGF